MTTNKGFTIALTSGYEQWWRYNAAMMCGCFDASGERIGFASNESHLADVGANLTQKPAGADGRTIRLDTMPCDHLMLYIYIVPHTLPEQIRIGEVQPFEATIGIAYNGKKLRSETRRIDQWSGGSIELRVEAE